MSPLFSTSHASANTPRLYRSRLNAPADFPRILCCNCGAPIDGTTATGALCFDCVKTTCDISQGIQRESTIHFCKDCDRWLLPPSTWITALPESRELLALCLKKLNKGPLGRVRIVDASFTWTEPHSRRIKVKITIQDSVQNGILLQQSFEVTFRVETNQCGECKMSYTPNHWEACCQVRQRGVRHPRTFLALEQLILKHGAHLNTQNIKEVAGTNGTGIDFFFGRKQDMDKFCDFLTSVVPVKMKHSSKLVSHNEQESTATKKYTASADLAHICKDDLVAIPIKLAKQAGNISPLLLCHKIGCSVYLMDPQTLQTADISSPIYWRAPFGSLADAARLVEFTVLDIELTGKQNGKWKLGEATVAKASDLGVNDNTYFVRTHLGGLLQPGDSAMGYLLSGTNFNSAEFEAIEASSQYGSTIPDVVLVKKYFPRRRKNRRRNWKLKRMDRDVGELLPKEADQERMDREYEMFLRDVEEDEELRATMALYKNQKRDEEEMSMTETEEGDDAPQVNMDELLDDFDELRMDDAQ